MSWIIVVATLVAIERLVELFYARRNTAALLAQGGVEVGAGHYPLFILLHGAWLLSLVMLVPAERTPAWPWVGFFILLQLCRLWIICSLGRYWTTRIITLADRPLIYLWHQKWLYAMNAKLAGFTPYPDGLIRPQGIKMQ